MAKWKIDWVGLIRTKWKTVKESNRNEEEYSKEKEQECIKNDIKKRQDQREVF